MIASPPIKPQQRRAWMSRKPVVTVLAILLAGAGILVTILAAKWPFTRAQMIKRLERASSAQVEIRSFRSTYFPPGCVAKGVVFRTARPDAKPLMSVSNLIIESSYRGLFSTPKRIKKLVVEDAKIQVPEGGAKLQSKQSSTGEATLIIEEFHARRAVVETGGSQPGQRPLSFVVHDAVFRNVGAARSIPFLLSLSNPLPPAELNIQGWIGPWRDDKGSVRSTPISGSCLLRGGDLSVFKSLAGSLSSEVNFSGTLAKLQLSGETHSPDFEVRKSGHQMPLETRFRGSVDLLHGDVVLPSLAATLGRTYLNASAEVTGYPKSVKLDVTQGNGQVQDLILLFSDAPRSAIAGPIRFQTSILLPAEKRPFEQRVRLTGDFQIGPARFTSPATRAHVDQLSERARGKKDQDGASNEEVLSRLNGHVTLADGVSRFSGVSFFVPGASALMHGTYNLTSKRVNLRGTMRMRAEISEATTGVKSFFLKLLDPFFKKKNAGAEIPVTMQGTYGHTHFTAGLK